MVALAEGCGRLSKLYLSWAGKLTDAAAVALAQRCPLELLSLHGIRGLSGATLDALETHRRDTLVALDVRGCVGMGSPTPAQLRARLPRLRTFIIHT